ncbi:DUF4179 domain-containing protein [Clostridium sp. SHJSY1]|uniref:DUF4179 domain-containing protein n=1 Tax=Clostridium sp. SHJSY1 TaxID=2942483 RepID=UPI0028759E3E|nr:DUF4179 domain-containing protein [Clostridium sp. SHJSY1]MDS0526246.1 DUF4179 domain-containing protein [Clostridium sp. SHJSY1]
MDNLENIKNEIKIPKGIDLAIKSGIKKGEKEKKLKKRKNVYKKVASAAAILVVMGSVVVIKPDIVKAIPGVQSIFKLIGYGNTGESFGKFEQFSTSINKSVEKNGINVTINEITIDGNTLAITSTMEGENLKEGIGYMGGIMLNGKSVDGWSNKDKKVDDNTLITVTEANISDLDLAEDVDVEINIVYVGEIKGPWNFKFKVSKSDKQTNSRVVQLNKTINIPNSTLKMDNISISPLGNTLNYSGIYNETQESQMNGIFDFVIIDDKGKMLQTKDVGSHSTKEKYEGKIEILNDLTNVKSVTVVPILKKWGIKRMDIYNSSYPILQTTINSTNFNIPQETITKSRPATKKEKSAGYSFNNVIHAFNIDKTREFSNIDGLVNQVIKVGNNSIVVIKGIEASEKETKVTFKIEGNCVYDYRNIDQAVIIDEEYNDFKLAEDGERAAFENVDEGIVSVKLPTIDKTKKYKIALPQIDEPEIEERYKINIDLEK